MKRRRSLTFAPATNPARGHPLNRRARLIRALSGAVIFGATASSQAVLMPGDVAVIGYNFDNPDEFAFVALNNLAGGEVIQFTDHGWLAAGGFRVNEGVFTFSTPPAGINAGTVITVTDPSGVDFSNDGDQIIAFQGTVASPMLIFGLNSNDPGWTADATNSNTSAQPPGIPTVAIPEIDNAIFNTGVLATGNKADWLAAITNPANWSGSNGTRQVMPAGPITVTGATGGGPIPGPANPVLINEIRVDQPGADVSEYFELVGTPGDTLNTLTYLVLGDGGGGGTGVIEAVISLNGFTIPADGHFLAAENTFALGAGLSLVDLNLGSDPALNFENDDTVTHLLVKDFTGVLGQDLDSNDDGVLDLMPWGTIFDGVGLLDNALPPTGEFSYAAGLGLPNLGPVGSDPPHFVFRLPDGAGPFQIGNSDPAASNDTPGAPNAVAAAIPEPMSGVLLGAAGIVLVWRRR